MREDTIKVYSFDELSDEAKQTAVEKLYDVNYSHEWWGCTYEDAARIGLVIEEFDIDRGAYCRGKWTEDAEDAARLILKNHGESCETYKAATAFLTGLKNAKRHMKLDQHFDHGHSDFDETDQYEELCGEFRRTICKDYRIILQNESEYLTSEESIIETIEANKYEFTADGTQY